MRIEAVTIFPEFFDVLDISLLGKARENNVIDFKAVNLRDYTHDKHKTVDDSPYGGGAGMLMKPEPWGEALDELVTAETILVIPTPSGRPFTQAMAQEFSGAQHIVFACGRYEGIDSRVAQHYQTKIRVEEVSIGDYVLAGGEVAVLVMVEAIARLVPGVLGNEQSFADDSFAAGQMEGLLEGPVFTRPLVWRDLEVPEVLTSGDHAKIAAWKHEQAKARTAQNRPDLMN